MIKIITAEERLKKRPKINIALFGPSGAGKTTQARTLDPETTLFVDLEAGTLALGDWPGAVLDVRATANERNVHPWELARAIACIISGPDPSDHSGPYCKLAHDNYVKALGGAEQFAKYKTFFVDSITVAARNCFAWSEMQPGAFSEKTSKPDKRGAYGIHGMEMTRWLTVLQHSSKSIIVVGILDKEKDEFNRINWTPQIEGAKTTRELPGIFDQILTLQNFITEDGRPYRAFVTSQQNPWDYPAKDRSGCLDMQEPPHLGKLIAKIEKGIRVDSLNLEIAKPAPKKENQPIVTHKEKQQYV